MFFYIYIQVSGGQALEKYGRGPDTTMTETNSVFSMNFPIGIAFCKDNPFIFSNEYGYDNQDYYYWVIAENGVVIDVFGRRLIRRQISRYRPIDFSVTYLYQVLNQNFCFRVKSLVTNIQSPNFETTSNQTSQNITQPESKMANVCNFYSPIQT